MAALTVSSFRLLMVYNIEAIHFVEYMLLAMILLPVLKSYGETVFWVTILGVLDELFQYKFLTPDFGYFDFNDCFLNLVGAGAGVLFIFISAGDSIETRQRKKWFLSPAIITGAGLLAVLIFLFLSSKMTINPTETFGIDSWFSLNREAMPDEFWTEAYPGRKFHIFRPCEGIFLLYLLCAGFFLFDYFFRKY